MQAHGNLAHVAGPTAFLKQLGIINKCTDEPDSRGYPLDDVGLFYVSRTPALCLNILKAGLEHIDPVIISAEDFFEKQLKVTALLVDSLVNVSYHYTAPYLTKKLLYHWLGRSECPATVLGLAKCKENKGFYSQHILK